MSDRQDQFQPLTLFFANWKQYPLGSTSRSEQSFHHFTACTINSNSPTYQPIQFESSTASFFGTISVKISPNQSYELTFNRTPDGKEFISSISRPLPSSASAPSTPSPASSTTSEFKVQTLPPILARVLTLFFPADSKVRCKFKKTAKLYYVRRNCASVTPARPCSGTSSGSKTQVPNSQNLQPQKLDEKNNEQQ